MKSHRGLASVVGAVFLIAIVIGGLSYVSYSLETMGNFSEALITEESRQKDKQDEAFEVVSIDIIGPESECRLMASKRSSGHAAGTTALPPATDV